jgi:glycosyltransferase involved in cell wall biosynthesis
VNERGPDLSIVIPACNEQDRIRPTLDSYLSHFEAVSKGRHELIVVVNGSTDRTEEIVRAYAAQHPSLRLVVIPERVGKGGAVLRGLGEGRGTLVGFVDADGSTPAAEFDRLASQIGPADVVVGSRWIKGADVTHAQSLGRRLGSRLFNFLVRLFFQLGIRDTQCGAKVFHRRVLDAILPTLGVSHWVFDVDMLYQVKKSGFKIREEPTTWHDVAGSKLRIFSSLVDVPYALFRLRLLYSPLRPVVEAWDRLIGRKIFENQLRTGKLSSRSEARKSSGADGL